MKKTVFFLLIVSTSYLILSAPVFAQTLTFERAYQDYQYSLNIYNQSYKEYEDARGFYLTNPTLSLKEEARLKTLKMLRDRSQLVIVYLTSLRAKISENVGLTDSEKASLFGKIDSEVAWYTEHKKNYGENDPLVDLFNKSGEDEAREKTFTKAIVYESLFYISLGEEVGIRNELEKIYSSLRPVIEAGSVSGKLDMNIFNRWFIDINNLLDVLKKEEAAAKTKILDLGKKSYSPESTYESGLEILTSSLVSLKKLNTFLIEMQTSMNNQP